MNNKNIGFPKIVNVFSELIKNFTQLSLPGNITFQSLFGSLSLKIESKVALI